jgi:hypothetical protein
LVQDLIQDDPIHRLGEERCIGYQADCQDNVEQSQQCQAQVMTLTLQHQANEFKYSQ